MRTKYINHFAITLMKSWLSIGIFRERGQTSFPMCKFILLTITTTTATTQKLKKWFVYICPCWGVPLLEKCWLAYPHFTLEQTTHCFINTSSQTSPAITPGCLSQDSPHFHALVAWLYMSVTIWTMVKWFCRNNKHVLVVCVVLFDLHCTIWNSRL